MQLKRLVLPLLFLVAMLAWVMPARAQCVYDASTNGQADNFSSTTSISVHLPASPTVGDECVASISGYNVGGISGFNINTSVPTGWAVQWCVTTAGDLNSQSETTCYATHTITGSDTSPVTFTASASVYGGAIVDCGKGCSGVDTGTSSASACTLSDFYVNSCTIPSQTLANAGDLYIVTAVVGGGAFACSTIASWSTPAGYTARSVCAAGGVGYGTYGPAALFDQALASSGASGMVSSLFNGTNGSGALIESGIALAPAATATPTPTPTPTATATATATPTATATATATPTATPTATATGGATATPTARPTPGSLGQPGFGPPSALGSKPEGFGGAP